jgi:predicted phage terminase large subunit-like protein
MGSKNRELFSLLKEKRLREARSNFLSYRKLINPKNKWGWWNLEIAAHLQEFFEDLQAGSRPKLIIQAPPQHGKSTQVVDFISWLAGKNPDVRAIYTSFSDRLGIRANLRLQRIYDSALYQETFPGTRINPANVTTSAGRTLRNREIIEYQDLDGYFRNTTVRGSITGESLDVGIIDDPIRGRADASSEAIREATWDWFTDDFFTRFSEQAGLLFILTRWHIDDPAGRLLEVMPDGVKVLRYPALATEDEAHRKKGEPLFPELKSLEFLLERKAAMSAGNWEALYQQNPVVAEGELFKPDALQTIDALPAGVERWVRGWDLASTTDGDYTAGARIGKLPDGRYVIADMVRVRCGPDERDAAIRNTAARDGRDTRVSLPQDPGQAGKTQALYLTRQLSGYRVKTSPESGDKVTRAEPFAAQVNVGNVLMLRGEWNKAMLDELRMFPNGTHDDQVDALSRAFGELISRGRGFFG